MKKILFFLVLLFSAFYAEAGHPQYTGGYISIQWLAGNTYQVSCITYTVGDPQNSGFCGSNPDVDTLRVWFGDGTSALLTRSNGTGDSVCTCRKMNIYTSIHTYPGSGWYYIWYDAIGRAANIFNMANSSFTDMFIFYSLSIPSAGGDTVLPSIANPPGCNYACTSNCYYYNPDVQTNDASSYLLGTPFQLNPGNPEVPTMARGYYNPGATINSATGELSWCNPAGDGLWNFAILIVPLNYPLDTEEVEMEVYVQNDCALGVNEVKGESEKLKVYPNPSSGAFTIRVESEKVKVESATVEIYNMLGEKIYSNYQITKSSNYQIDLSNQPSGIYFYRAITNSGSLIGEGKLVIQK